MPVSCDKALYADRESAEVAIVGIRNNRSIGISKVKPVRSYYCIHCRAWHITSLKPRMRIIKPTTIELNTLGRSSSGNLLIRTMSMACELNRLPSHYVINDKRNSYISEK